MTVRTHTPTMRSVHVYIYKENQKSKEEIFRAGKSIRHDRRRCPSCPIVSRARNIIL